jgi:hypothetical protein
MAHRDFHCDLPSHDKDDKKLKLIDFVFLTKIELQLPTIPLSTSVFAKLINVFKLFWRTILYFFLVNLTVLLLNRIM